MANAEELLKDFYAVFHGSRDKFVIHQAPFKTEPNGKTKASRVFYALKDPRDKENKEKLPVSIDDYKDHLMGKKGVAIEPLCNTTDKKGNTLRNVCYYGVIDIDVYGDAGRFLHLIRRMYEVGLKFTACSSKSKGIHIYFMFKRAEKASDVIDMLRRIISLYGLDFLYCDDKHKTKVEYFPMHATEVPGEDGKCVFLPYFGAASDEGALNKVISLDGKYLGLEKALDLIKQNYTSVAEVNEVLDNLPYSDAPYCIQMMALTGALGDNAGRNKFLFHACVYFKRKFGKDYDYFDELLELDNCMEKPLQYEDLQGIKSTYESANSKDWNYSCRHDPMCSYCDKAACKKRQYSGTFKDNARENENTGADMMGEISRVMTRVPYYIWTIAAPGKEPKDVRFDDITELYNQSTVQMKCLDQLGWSPLPIKPALWIQKLNDCMEGIENRQIQVSAESDTSELSELDSLITNYLTHRQIQNGAAYMIQVGQVYHNDGYYYFSTEGIKEFLRVEKYNTGRTNLREELMRFGCEEGLVKYTTKGGAERTIKCWKKKEDASLSDRLAFYDDVYSADAERAATIQLAKDKLEEKDENNLDEDRF